MNNRLTVQAVDTREALENFPFKACFTSSLTRAAETADELWKGKEGPLIKLDNLNEANLGYLQGLTNEYAKEKHSEVYGAHTCPCANGMAISLQETKIVFHVRCIICSKMLFNVCALHCLLAVQGSGDNSLRTS